MIENGWTRKNVNTMVGRLKRVFRWGNAQELVPSDVIIGLDSVEGLKKGRCNAKESQPVKPVPITHVTTIERHVSRQIWAMVQLQLLTAARPGEVIKMRPVDINMQGQVWEYTPQDHKTAYRGHERAIYIGSKGQEIIRDFLNRPLDAYLFSPRDAVAEKAAQAPTHRRPDQKPNLRQTSRWVGDCYTIASYRSAIKRACKKAKVPEWSPNRLRHNAATEIRREFGLEAAQLMLGHQKCDTTQVYAEVNREKALQIAAKIG